MTRTLTLIAALGLLGGAFAEDKIPAHPYVKIETTEGNILMELDGKRAPFTVKHFLALVDDGYYDGLIFHRVIPDFMAQTGAYTPDMKSRESEGSIPNESGNGLENIRGTVAMARTAEPHSANAQFFINVNDNMSLNPRADRWGYAVFGYVIEGMEVVDKIVSVRTGPAGQFSQDVPMIPIVIKKLSRYEFE